MIDTQLQSQDNVRIFSVTTISNKIKELLENNLGVIKIKGEISGLKIAASGHGYFNLKDNNAVIAAICWRYQLSKVNFKLVEGLEVVITGKVTAYAMQSKYQISVENIQPAGDGAFMQILRERKERLEKEGLFDKEYKKPIPFMPRKIGIITSVHGAVIKDIIHRITDRCPAHLIVWPVAVQGEKSSDEVTKAIDGFNNFAADDEKRVDVIIVARGGGSIEDLWSFNEENVVRSAHASKIPVISAIGHETDYTLLDLVADVRAPTPTAAAEFVSPVLENLLYTVESIFLSISGKAKVLLRHQAQILNGFERIYQYPKYFITNYIQKIDECSIRLETSMPNILTNKTLSFKAINLTNYILYQILNNKKKILDNIMQSMIYTNNTILKEFEHKLNINSSLLDSLDYKKVLERGYAMIKGQKGQYVASCDEMQHDDTIKIIMSDGAVNCIVHKK